MLMFNGDKTRVVIAGGGTAGWMAAAAISKLIGESVEVTLVESDDIPTIGVGEATIPTLHIFHQLLGIAEHTFMAQTQATFKLGIQFEKWNGEQSNYLHSFGYLGKDCWAAQFHHFWLKGREFSINDPIGDYCPEHLAAREGRFYTDSKQKRNYAYHLDATRYAQFLRKFSEALGVKRQEGKIESVQLNDENGCITSLKLQSGENVPGDLFIDCTGFRGLLIEGALKTGYEDWSHWLPCNRALAMQTKSLGDPLPYTRAITHEAGWRWKIPLQNRTGNGFVFCSDYMTDDQASSIFLKALEGEEGLNDPRVIPFLTGTRRQHWNKNCVALGLASGFIEPLESTSIHLIQRSIIRLLHLFPKNGLSQSSIDEFNLRTRMQLENIRDFIVLHYHFTDGLQSDFWQEYRRRVIPDSLQHRVSMFKEAARIYKHDDDLFEEGSWVQVMLGQGIDADSYHPIVDQMSEQELKKFMAGIRGSVQSFVSRWPTHNAFIDQYCRG